MKDDLRARAVQPPAWRAMRLLAALVFVYGALALPDDVRRFSVGLLLPPPVELAAFVLLAAILPGVLRRPLHLMAGLALGMLLIVKLADMAAREALARAFNPVLDFHLLDAAWNLLSGALGLAAAALVVVCMLSVLLLAVIASLASARILAARVGEYPVGWGVPAACFLLVWLAGPMVAGGDGVRIASTRNTDLAAFHARSFAASLDDLQRFRRQAAVDPVAAVPRKQLFSAFGTRDVIMLFVESYGRTVLRNDDYRRHVLPVLQAFEEAIEREDYAAASGFLRSPVAGGQSWLAHASVLSGLWVDSQRRYNSLLVSDRRTLIDDFKAAGRRTVAVMPAITMPWPEGESFGYDAIYNARKLDYRGLPFNWVTMPDQYTLAAFDRLERLRAQRPPLFAEIALISSHAPWTPVPEVIDWDSVGDGSIFDGQARSGATPREVWSDMDRVRLQYRRSIEYALANISSYVVERLDTGFVVIVLGDHQPARSITGATDNRDVPFHVISDDSGLIRRLKQGLGLAGGMLPPDDLQSIPMDEFRTRLVRAASGAPSGGNGGEPGLGPT